VKRLSKENHIIFLVTVGLAGWMAPGAGYLLFNERKRAIIIFVTLTLTFCMGLYAGSIGVIDPISSKAWYVAQVLNSPLVFILGHHTAAGGFPVYAKPNEIGQVYTSISGMLNLLCIVNCVYCAHIYCKK
jgi:hypothetical protein